jgi:hypothetical protein
MGRTQRLENLMNEQIKLLAKQADIDLIHGNFLTGPHEKFAELIIQECISACATDRLGKTAGAEELINQHFGVEL